MANYQNVLKKNKGCNHKPPFFCWCGCELHKAFTKDKSFFMWVCSDCVDKYESFSDLPFHDDWDDDLDSF